MSGQAAREWAAAEMEWAAGGMPSAVRRWGLMNGETPCMARRQDPMLSVGC